MPRKKGAPESKAGGDPQSTFITNAYDFFSSVLTSIAKDDFLRVLWGVEVLLFSILVLMILFGNVSPDQRFSLALVIVGSVVLTFAFSAWRSGGRAAATRDVASNPPTTGRATAHIPPSASAASREAVVQQARKCLMLLGQIHEANARIVQRGRSGGDLWAKMLTDTYGRVCDARHRRRLGTEPPDAYFDGVCAEPDVGTVCDKKWELGEALDDYRRRLNEVSPPPLDHDGLELLIRRSVTQPDRSPVELEAALIQALDSAKRVA